MATDDELLTIGAFGRLVGLTPSALRFYDDCGLLRPARVDPGSGYRLYAVEQEPRAMLLRALRAVGLPLAEARLALDAPAAEVARAVRAHLRSLEDALAPARDAAAQLLAELGEPTPLDEPSGGWRVRLSGPELASAARQVVPAAATGEAGALTCVLLEATLHEVRLVATDRYRLAVRVLQASTPLGAAGSALVPAAGLAELGAWAVGHAEVDLFGGPTAVELVAGAERRSLPVVEAEYPDYRIVLDALAPAGVRVVVDRLALMDLLREVEPPGVVALDVGADTVAVSVPGGRTLGALAAVCSGTTVRVGFAADVLAAALASSVGPDVLLDVVAPDRAVVVRSADQGSFTTLAMPSPLGAGG